MENVPVRNGLIAWPPVLLRAAFSRNTHPNNNKHSTLHFLGASAIHPPSVKSIRWTVVEIIEGQTETP